jgi:hypothetical protein
MCPNKFASRFSKRGGVIAPFLSFIAGFSAWRLSVNHGFAVMLFVGRFLRLSEPQESPGSQIGAPLHRLATLGLIDAR